MHPYLVTASINELKNLEPLLPELRDTETRILVIDEGDPAIRSHNNKFDGVPIRFFGPAEREAWFNARFGSGYGRYFDAIPNRCHAETSFGFLIALEEGAKFVLELDDDVFSDSLIRKHSDNLFGEGGEMVTSECHWFNTLELVNMNRSGKFFPRGHPYSPDARMGGCCHWFAGGSQCVLNMGHWTGNPDFDAMTVLVHKGINGVCHIKSMSLTQPKTIVGAGTYFAICSMNTSFVPRIIPAFYQLYMNTMGVDRFDDIWSGIFLKRIADEMGEGVCLGQPAGEHRKTPRNVFRDLRKELEGMQINELLWQIASEDLTGSSYPDLYLSLADNLERYNHRLQEEGQKKFLSLQVGKMRLWVEICDAIS